MFHRVVSIHFFARGAGNEATCCYLYRKISESKCKEGGAWLNLSRSGNIGIEV